MLSVVVITILVITNIFIGALLVTVVEDYHQLEGEVEELVANYSKTLDEYRYREGGR